MRTRKELMEELMDDLEGSNAPLMQRAYLRKQLEVLLDIRDLLTPNSQK